MLEKTQKNVSFEFYSEEKFIKNAKNGQFGEFLKPEACSQKVLPDKSILIGQKLVKITKVKNFKWDISGNFQTLRYSVPWVSPRELIHCNVTFIFQICLQMVFAYLQSVLCSGHYRLLHYDGHFSRPTFFLWCQASHLDGHWDLVNVLRIVLWSRGQRCCGILYGKNGCSNRRKYLKSKKNKE